MSFIDSVWAFATLDNTLADWVMALAWFFGLWVVFLVIQRVVLMRLGHLAKRTATDIDDTLIAVVNSVRPPVYIVLALYFALRSLTLAELLTRIANGVLLVVIVWQVVMSVQILVDFVLRKKLLKSRGEERNDKTMRSALDIVGKITKVILWSIGGLFILSNFGINVTSLVASLGIGGIAVALALQNILGDLFSSLAIYLDRPFEIGDTIKVGDVIGKVKHVGIKTTRIQALSGEEVILSNQELTTAKVQNYQRMKERRVAMDLGVTYETPLEKLKGMSELFQEAFNGIDKTRFARAHFKTFGDSALVFEVVWYFEDPDYKSYMEARQRVNLAIKEALDKQGIEMAYPTQTLYVHTKEKETVRTS